MLTINKFISSLEVKVYYLQQIVYPFLSSELDSPTPYIFTFLFIGGLLTSLNPCLISIIPLIISYINNKKKNNKRKYTFIAGLISSLMSIIGLSIIIHSYYNSIIFNIPILTSILIIIIGLNLLQILNLNSFRINALEVDQFNTNENVSNFMIGLIFGLSSFSCSTPILVTILLRLYNNQNILLGIIYLTFYLLGYIIPIIILIEITINYSKIKIISQTWNYLMPVSGSFILGIGIFSFLEHIFLD